MSKDTISKSIIIILNRPYLLKLTFASMLAIENVYGTFGAGVAALGNFDNPEMFIETVLNFLQVMSGADKSELQDTLTLEALLDANCKISDTLKAHLPDVDEETLGSPSSGVEYDWDSIYYIGRYHLLMTDSEFWATTPRRFWRLSDFWAIANGAKSNDEPKVVYADQINW